MYALIKGRNPSRLEAIFNKPFITDYNHKSKKTICKNLQNATLINIEH